MLKILFRPINIILAVFGIVCFIVAISINFDSSDLSVLMNTPIEGVCKFIRDIYLEGNIFGAWCVYILLGALPLIYPVAKTIKLRRFYPLCLIWVVLSCYVFVALYFLINPHLLNSTVFTQITEEVEKTMRTVTTLGFQITFCILLIICILCESGLYLKNNPHKAYFLAKLIIYIFAFAITFSAFFLDIIVAKINWNSLVVSPELAEYVKLDMSVNRFSIVISVLSEIVPAVITVILLLKCANILGLLEHDPFKKSNIKPLNTVIKFAEISVLVTLSAMAINNIVQLCLSTKLLKASYCLEIHLGALLVICLVIIFAEILKRAIMINEENELTI